MKSKRQFHPTRSLVRLCIALVLLGLISILGIALARLGRADIIADLDWGDAPDSPAAAFYPTLSINSGASHVLGGPVYLGFCVDAEPDGQPTAGADGDDVNAGSPAFGPCPRSDDEDGVTLLSPLYLSDTVYIEVVASAPCTLTAWVDLNRDYSWDDAGEDIFPGGQGLSAGVNPLSFFVPPTASLGDTYARFRCTTDGAVSYTGTASDGEVEDYQVTILTRWDWGDAPDPTYPTLMSSDAAYHLMGSGIYLGNCVDADPDGQPSPNALGDDVNPLPPVEGTCVGGDDEDGVILATDLTIGEPAQISVTASAPCTLTGWIDYNRDGDWIDNLEELFPGGESLVTGTQSLSFTVPTGALETTTFARFRCTSAGPVGIWGGAPDGEVEDYRVRVGDPLDLGDAPDPTYPTMLASSGASHGLGSGLYLGNCVDGEWDGQPNIPATGDDASPGAPVYGTCTGDDDEDGVTFTSSLISGTTAFIDVVASEPCWLGGWIDFSRDGDWDDTGEDIFPGATWITAGTNGLSFSVPAKAVTGPTYARFRCTTFQDFTYTGHLPDGEVEDYRIRIGPTLDLGDAPDPTYPTLLGSGGASHAVGDTVYMGSCVDGEVNGQPTPLARGDDLIPGYQVVGTCAGGDDEDGVAFGGPLSISTTKEISVTVNEDCTLSAWVDFNRDGDWADAGEDIFPGGEDLVLGLNPLTFTVPSGATPGPSFARFRCTTAGPVSYTGHAPDGEVEDYRVAIVSDWDMGDAPDPTYPTLASSAGALHALGSDVYLGDCVDAEVNGQPTAAADGDDVNVGSTTFGNCVRTNDEDGVAFTTPLYVGDTADVSVVAHEDCTLSAWVDFDGDGDWNDGGENLFPGGQPLTAGINDLSFAVPSGATVGDTIARFRCTTDGPVPFTGIASDGEVEDYAVTILPNWDFGDALDPTFPTLLANDGPYHTLGSSVYLGYCVDADPDGQPTAAADGDDASTGSPVYGTCQGGDGDEGSSEGDEDGVTFASPLLAGQVVTISVLANHTCTLSGWVDYNQDGDWDDAGEDLFPGGAALTAGANILPITVTADAPWGDAYARFRCTTSGAISYTGHAPDGEVEDYRVEIIPAGGLTYACLPLVLRE